MGGKSVVAALFLLLAGLCWAGPGWAEDGDLLDGHMQLTHLDDAPEAPGLLRQEWQRIAEEAKVYLRGHPAESKGKIPSVDENSSGNFVYLDSRTVALSVRFASAGAVFILERDDKGGFRTLWSLDRAKKRNRRLPEAIEAWTAENARDSCKPSKPHGSYARCGPLSGEVGLLAPARDGSPRFYVLATYAQDMGATSTRQFTVWTWRKGKAVLLYHGLYAYMFEKDEDDTFAADLIELREKHGFKAFMVCGACEGRQMRRRLKVEGERIVDLGLTSLTPELDLIDAFMWRILNGRPTRDLAEEPVAVKLKAHVARLKAAGEISRDLLSFGMFDSVVRQDGEVRKLCLATETAPYIFTLRPPGKARRIAAVEDFPSANCLSWLRQD